MFLTKAKVDSMFKRECDRASIASESFNLKPPYSDKVAAKQFPLSIKCTNSKSPTVRKENTRGHVAGFLDSMGTFLNDIELCD